MIVQNFFEFGVFIQLFNYRNYRLDFVGQIFRGRKMGVVDFIIIICEYYMVYKV